MPRMLEALRLRREFSRDSALWPHGYQVRRKPSLLREQDLSQYAGTSEDDDSDGGYDASGVYDANGIPNKPTTVVEEAKSRSLFRRSALVVYLIKSDWGKSATERTNANSSTGSIHSEVSNRSSRRRKGASRMLEALRLRNESPSGSHRCSPDHGPNLSQRLQLLPQTPNFDEMKKVREGTNGRDSLLSPSTGNREEHNQAISPTKGEAKPVDNMSVTDSKAAPITRDDGDASGQTICIQGGASTSRMQEALRLRTELSSEDAVATQSCFPVLRKSSLLQHLECTPFADSSEHDISGDENYAHDDDDLESRQIPEREETRNLSQRSALVAILMSSQKTNRERDQSPNRVHVRQEATRAALLEEIRTRFKSTSTSTSLIQIQAADPLENGDSATS